MPGLRRCVTCQHYAPPGHAAECGTLTAQEAESFLAWLRAGCPREEFTTVARRKPITDKPTYKGERRDHTSKDRVICEHCETFAHYRVRRVVDGDPYDEVMCEECLKQAIRQGDNVRAAELPEYRKHLARLGRWEAQRNAGTQESML